jgi:A/G-specific adenine glycosylase
MIEANSETDTSEILVAAENNGLLDNKQYELSSVSPLFKQQLSHQLIIGRFLRIKLAKKILFNKKEKWVTKSELRQYAFPKFINQYMQQHAAQSLF